MKNNDFLKLEEELVRKSQKRASKKKPKMKVSGASVKNLEKIIKNK